MSMVPVAIVKMAPIAIVPVTTKNGSFCAKLPEVQKRGILAACAVPVQNCTSLMSASRTGPSIRYPESRYPDASGYRPSASSSTSIE